MKVTVDSNSCNGHGECIITVPEVFALPDDSDTAQVIAPEPGDESRAAVERAVALCSVSAIFVRG